MLFQQIIKDILNNNTYIKMTAALKEQMADLEETLRKNQNKLKDLKKKESDMLKENEKNLLNLKKEYDIWQKYKNYWMF
jgi:predicted  nucleic acid-binding Zn-ribbon protein